MKNVLGFELKNEELNEWKVSKSHNKKNKSIIFNEIMWRVFFKAPT